MARWLRRLAVVATLTLAMLWLFAIPPAFADDTIGLASGQLPAVATADQRECSTWSGPNDLWRFELSDGRFLSLTLIFAGPGLATHVRTVEASAAGDPSAGVDEGARTAWVTTEPGWSLVDASAVVTGTAREFYLALACPATGLAALAPIAGGDSPTTEALTTLPLTGRADIAGMVTLGSTIVLAGVLLSVVRRQPRGRHRAPRGYEPDDIRRPVITAPR